MRSECKEVKPEKSAKSGLWRGFTNIWVGYGSECLYALCIVLLGDGTLRCDCKEVKWAKKWQKSAKVSGGGDSVIFG